MKLKVAFRSHPLLISKTNRNFQGSCEACPQIFISPLRSFHSLQLTAPYLGNEVQLLLS